MITTQSLEKCTFNILMYATMSMGTLAAIAVDMLNTFVLAQAFWYNFAILTGTMAVGALCHFFLHRAASYIFWYGDREDKLYEETVGKHSTTPAVVVILNTIFLTVLVGFMIKTVSLSVRAFDGVTGRFVYSIVTTSLFSVALGIFVTAPKIAKMGWGR